jgi:hypothetical protein
LQEHAPGEEGTVSTWEAGARSDETASVAGPGATEAHDSLALAASKTGVPLEGSFKVFREHWIELGEREYLRRMLERHGRNVATLSKEAEVDRTYIYRLMKKY